MVQHLIGFDDGDFDIRYIMFFKNMTSLLLWNVAVLKSGDALLVSCGHLLYDKIDGMIFIGWCWRSELPSLLESSIG